jgi:hypothetical protein
MTRRRLLAEKKEFVRFGSVRALWLSRFLSVASSNGFANVLDPYRVQTGKKKDGSCAMKRGQQLNHPSDALPPLTLSKPTSWVYSHLFAKRVDGTIRIGDPNGLLDGSTTNAPLIQKSADKIVAQRNAGFVLA